MALVAPEATGQHVVAFIEGLTTQVEKEQTTGYWSY